MANDPSQPPSPNPDDPSNAAGSSRASSKASPSDPLVADPGPAFDPDNAPPAPEPPPLSTPELAAAAPEWEEDALRSLLGLKGRLLHAAAGAAEQDWIYTELDLQAIAPPLTRICNRYEPIRRYAGSADPILVGMGVGGYALRSLIERQQARGEEAPTETVIPAAEGQPFAPASSPPQPPAPQETASPARGAPPPAPPPPPAPRAPAPVEGVDPSAISWERQGG